MNTEEHLTRIGDSLTLIGAKEALESLTALPNPESPKEDAPASNGLSGVEVELRAQIAALTAELVQARALNRQSVCTYCGHIEEVTERNQLREIMARHITQCPRHPLNRIAEVMGATTSELRQRINVLEEALRQVPVIIQEEAYLPQYVPGSEDEPSCEGAESDWCQSAVDIACDIRNRTLARVAALSTALPICGTSPKRATDEGLSEKEGPQ